jgi:hypothetical protein
MKKAASVLWTRLRRETAGSDARLVRSAFDVVQLDSILIACVIHGLPFAGRSRVGLNLFGNLLYLGLCSVQGVAGDRAHLPEQLIALLAHELVFLLRFGNSQRYGSTHADGQRAQGERILVPRAVDLALSVRYKALGLPLRLAYAVLRSVGRFLRNLLDIGSDFLRALGDVRCGSARTIHRICLLGARVRLVAVA